MSGTTESKKEKLGYTINRDKDGNILSYRFRVCVGRDADYRQIWRTKTIPRPEGLTPAREAREVERLCANWKAEEKKRFESEGRKREDKSKITLHNFIDKHFIPVFVENGKHAPNTIGVYKNNCKVIKRYFAKDKRLSAISTEDVLGFIKWLSNEAISEHGSRYSAATIKMVFGSFSTLLRFGRRMKYIHENPLEDLDANDKPRKERRPVDFLTVEEAERFIKALSGEKLFWRCYFELLITSGLRRGEALALRWGDLDTKNGKLTIERNLTPTPEGVKEGLPKTRTARTVGVAPNVVKLLHELRREQTQNFGAMVDSAYIFASPVDPCKPIRPGTVTDWLRNFEKRNNLPDMSPHDLRHTAGSLMLKQTGNIKIVQEALGHSDPKTTLSYYVGVEKEEVFRAVDAVGALLTGTSS